MTAHGSVDARACNAAEAVELSGGSCRTSPSPRARQGRRTLSLAVIREADGLAPAGSGLWEQAELAGLGDRLGPGADPELAVDGLDLAADGVDRDLQFPADLPVRQLGGEQPQDRQLPFGERLDDLDPAAGRCAERWLGLGNKGRKHAGVGEPVDQLAGRFQQRGSARGVAGSVADRGEQQQPMAAVHGHGVDPE